MTTYRSTLVGVASLMALAAPSLAQDFSGAPSYGTLDFNGTSASQAARAGGALGLDRLEVGCPGYASAQPSFNIRVDQSGPLYIAAGSDEDLTMAVRAPDGTISCDDDSAGDLNPGISFDEAAPGVYEVWVGTFAAGVGYPQIIAHVSSSRFDTDNPFIVRADPMADGERTQRLSDSGGTWSTSVIAGGPASLDVLGDEENWCSGYSGNQPDLVVDYARGDRRAYWLLESEGDTTLAIVTPSGETFCNDDQIGLDAGIMIDRPEPGRYAIFAGVLGGRNEMLDATLSLSDTGFGGVDRSLNFDQTPRFGRQTVSTPLANDPQVFEIAAGGNVGLFDALSSIGASEGYCAGYASRTASISLDYPGGAPLHLSMVSEIDTTLAVMGPDGSWSCDDDSLGESNPAVILDGDAGRYVVYAGAFSEDAEAPAALYVSNTGPGSDPTRLMMDVNAEPVFGLVQLQPGFNAQNMRMPVEAGGTANPRFNNTEEYCAGSFSTAPSMAIDWSGGTRLSFLAESEGDLTLAIRTPDGSWVCDDDSGGELNPAVKVEIAPAGMYQVWVGTFGDEPESGTLLISEDDVLDHLGDEIYLDPH